MTTTIIERLFSSFADLEKAIMSAKHTLAQKQQIPAGIMDRINSYDSILAKQRSLATRLSEFMSQGNWDEVSRHVSLINGLSVMVRDDARAILMALSGELGEKVDQSKYC